MKNTLAQIGIYILLFLVLNGILWGVQELWHSKDNQKLSEIENRIEYLDATNNSFVKNMNLYGSSQLEYSQYSSRIDERNKLADEYNSLSKSSGSRWYLIPIPMPGRGGKPIK